MITNEMSKQCMQQGLPLFHPDMANLLARSDLYVQGPVPFGPEGIPVANGRFGGPIWQPDAATLALQLNHTDAFMYHDASAASLPEGGALGRIRIGLGGNVFDIDTLQHLSLYTGQLTIQTPAVSLLAVADMDRDTLLIRIDDRRKTPEDIIIEMDMLRPAQVERASFSAKSEWILNGKTATLKQIFSEACDTGIAVNDFFCQTALSIRIAEDTDTMLAVANNHIIMTLPAQCGCRTLVIGGCACMDRNESVADKTHEAMEESLDFDAVSAKTKTWWAAFWNQSYVYLPGQPAFEMRRNYYFYLAAISNRGQYPCKYNGGIWIAEGDRRDWGSWYWNWNQDSLFQPFLDANHGELLEPMFRMRELCFRQYETAARQMWGSKGIFIGETSGILGFETLPEDVASDLRAYYTTDAPLSERVKQFGDRRNGFLTPWNWKLSGDRVSYVTHTLVATQETAEYFWMQYRYTGDVEWLREHAYPFIRGAAELYRTYPGFMKEADGRYHFHRTNLHEHIWGGTDVIDDLSLARGIFTAAINAAETLATDGELRKLWRECLDNLADYPNSSDPDALGYASQHAGDKVVWAQARKPALTIRDTDCTESPQFKMLEKFDVLNMETRDQGLDRGEWQIALNTYFATPGYRNQLFRHEEDKNGSSRFLIDAAKLGRGEDLSVMFHSQYKQFADTPNLLHNEGDYYSAEGYGTWAAALQLALNQSIAPLPDAEPVIRVFPAWPVDWDVKYKLAAKGGFTVAASMQKGVVEYVEIDSTIGGLCRIRNPWEESIDLYRNGEREQTLAEERNQLISLETQPNDRLILVETGKQPSAFATNAVLEEKPVYRSAVIIDPEHQSQRWGV